MLGELTMKREILGLPTAVAIAALLLIILLKLASC